MQKEYERFAGAIVGMMTGDALGAQVEFMSVLSIKDYFSCCSSHLCMMRNPEKVLKAGQVTDDSEMAFSLGYAIIENNGSYNPTTVRKHYIKWANSRPMDIGITTQNALMREHYDPRSEANGALMRISPLAAFYRNKTDAEIAKLAKADCNITHINRICESCNELYSIAIAHLIKGEPLMNMYNWLCSYAKEKEYPQAVIEVLQNSQYRPPRTYTSKIGWVLTAFHNAFYRLINEASFDDIMRTTILSGGDTDTNAAIAGALAGAYYGINEIPDDWIITMKTCEPDRPKKYHPRSGLKMVQDLWEM